MKELTGQKILEILINKDKTVLKFVCEERDFYFDAFYNLCKCCCHSRFSGISFLNHKPLPAAVVSVDVEHTEIYRVDIKTIKISKYTITTTDDVLIVYHEWTDKESRLMGAPAKIDECLSKSYEFEDFRTVKESFIDYFRCVNFEEFNSATFAVNPNYLEKIGKQDAENDVCIEVATQELEKCDLGFENFRYLKNVTTIKDGEIDLSGCYVFLLRGADLYSCLKKDFIDVVKKGGEVKFEWTAKFESPCGIRFY